MFWRFTIFRLAKPAFFRYNEVEFTLVCFISKMFAYFLCYANILLIKYTNVNSTSLYLKKAGLASRNIVHLQNILPTLYRSLLLYFYFYFCILVKMLQFTSIVGYTCHVDLRTYTCHVDLRTSRVFLPYLGSVSMCIYIINFVSQTRPSPNHFSPCRNSPCYRQSELDVNLCSPKFCCLVVFEGNY